MNRIVDLGVAIVGLGAAAPVLLVLAILVKMDTRGPAIFKQLRVGRDQRLFWCYKVRTMNTAVPNVPTHLAPNHYVTPLGRILRKYKLDEIPQLLNVLKGEMSIVGPRPCLPTQSELVRLREDRGIFADRPGITGLAQVCGIDMSDPERLVRIESEYIAHRSPMLDLRILGWTLAGIRPNWGGAFARR